MVPEILEPYDVIVSTWRWLAGLIAGSTLGLIVAVVVYLLAPIREFVLSIAGFLRALPILALVPLFQWGIGIDEFPKILLITWACFFPVFVSTVRSTGRRINDLEIRMASHGMSSFAQFRHYDLPRLLFGFLAGVEVSIGIGWLTVVAAEMIGTFNQGVFRGGLGHAVFFAFEHSNYIQGFVCLGLFGTLGWSSAVLWSRLSGKLVKLAGYDRAALAA